MIVSGAMFRFWNRSASITGTTAAANAMLSRSGTPASLSTSGSIPDTPHNPPARMHVGTGTS